MRLKAKLRLGFYPLAVADAKRIRNYLQFPNEPASILDPCAGTGAALHAVSEGAPVRRYGIELDAYRADEARKILRAALSNHRNTSESAAISHALTLKQWISFEIQTQGPEAELVPVLVEQIASLEIRFRTEGGKVRFKQIVETGNMLIRIERPAVGD